MSSSSGAPASAAATGAPGVSTSTSSTPDAASRRAPPLVKKQRILWDSDAATRGGKTSIAVLLDWLTVPRNYTRWRAGKSQFGETRETLCSEIKAEMRRNGIVHRENANIRTQISELERSYDAAVAWLVQSGYLDGRIPDAAGVAAAAKTLPVGVDASNESSSNPVEAYVLRMCRYYHVLDAVMRQPTTAASATTASTTNAPSPLRPAVARKAQRNLQVLKKKAAIATTNDEENEAQPGDSDWSTGVNETSSEASGEKVAESTPVPETEETAPAASGVKAPESERASLPAMASLANRAAERRPPMQKRKSQPSSPRASASMSTNSMISSFGTPVPIAPAPANTSAQSEPQQSGAASSSYVTNDDPTPRQPYEDTREERDRKRFRMDEERNQLECEKLRLEVQTAKLRLQVERVRARKQLAEAGLSQTEIDAMVYNRE